MSTIVSVWLSQIIHWVEQSTGSVTHPGVNRSVDEEEDDRKEWWPGPVSPEVNGGVTLSCIFLNLKKFYYIYSKGYKVYTS